MPTQTCIFLQTQNVLHTSTITKNKDNVEKRKKDLRQCRKDSDNAERIETMQKKLRQCRWQTLLKLIFSAFLTSKGNPKIPILEETEAGKKKQQGFF